MLIDGKVHFSIVKTWEHSSCTKLTKTHTNGGLAPSHFSGDVFDILTLPMESEQESVFCSRPLLVSIWMDVIAPFYHLLRIQELIDEDRRVAVIIHDNCLYLRPSNSHIKKPSFFAVWELVRFCKHDI